jgi:ribose/xylose/arabinose/galactoside ABC-type transport system permease subunit
MTAVASRAETRPSSGRLMRWRPDRAGAPIVLALVLVAGSVVFGDSFASGRNLGNIALDSSYLLLIATGMTFVILSGGIDLSVGSLLALSGVLTAYGSRWGTLTAVLLPLAVCGAIGLVNGLLIGRARIAPFIVTLAALLFARGLAFAVADEGNTVYIIPADLTLTEVGQARWLGLSAPVWIAMAFFAAGVVVLNRTRFGQATFAIGDSQEAAELMGLPVARVRVLVYVLSALLTGIAGVLVAAQTQSGLPTIGEGRELEAIAAVVIGGTLLTGGAGSLGGTLAGVLLLKVIQNLINQVGTLNAYYQQVVSGTFLLVVVLIQSRLTRRRTR